MTNEELLKPRYKAIAADTSQNFKVGDILTKWDVEGWQNGWITNHHLRNAKHNIISDPEKYPHLFKPLHWAEERSESEMPMYMKSIHNERYVVVATKHLRGGAYHGNNYFSYAGGITDGCYDDFLPATLDEYTTYQQSITNHFKQQKIV